MSKFLWKIDKQLKKNFARTGTISTPHGTIKTPAFIFCATKGALKSFSTSDAKKRAERFAKNRGVLIGISAGANLLAAEKLFQNYKISGAIVTMLCDRGERYLSQ